jgi:hypothetical protein
MVVEWVGWIEGQQVNLDGASVAAFLWHAQRRYSQESSPGLVVSFRQGTRPLSSREWRMRDRTRTKLPQEPSRRSPVQRWAIGIASVLVLYLTLSYLLLPRLWEHHEHQPGLASKGAVTHTADGIPGDPLNVGIVGDKTDLLRAMNDAGWIPADPITFSNGSSSCCSVSSGSYRWVPAFSACSVGT